MTAITERQQDTDAEHEARIKAALDASAAARSRGDLHEAQQQWNEAVRLIDMRSPEQVARMEQEKGLA